MRTDQNYDVIVVGGGHAGCEAASAAARLGCSVLLVTQNPSALARMSCNPAIGGLAKGHLVREMDALGGLMGRVTDRSAIQSRMLNRSKGPAVWSPRAQCDRRRYTEVMTAMIAATPGLEMAAGEAVRLILDGDRAAGIVTRAGEEYRGRRVILAGGTFWNGLIHIGEWSRPAGRIHEEPAVGLSDHLAALGLRRLRLKTGTPPRLDGRTIDFSRTDRQDSDPEPVWFSHPPPEERLPQVPCWLTSTNACTHEILRGGLDRSPLYTGRIQGIGPRYCPSIEDKIVRFTDKERHQLFLEPEGLDTDEYYINGFATSLPEDVQIAALRTVPGLEQVVVNRPGYAVEYDMFPADQLRPSLECRALEHLYLAGQVNGTSGYEEAAAQGFMAGVNAARSLHGRDPVVLGRNQAYIGVLMDDLITKVPEEPYRMFTSRAEFRLLLRQDNARQRLLDVAREIALQPDAEIQAVEASLQRQAQIRQVLERERVRVEDQCLPLAKYLRRPEVSLQGEAAYNLVSAELQTLVRWDPEAAFQAELEIKYDGYLTRQEANVEALRRLEALKLPESFDYARLKALSAEARQVLQQRKPATLGQASRIPGVRASDVTIIMVHLRRG
ncbi:MAG: tRNA uridine-5-carboxymethylaminomethyl(34) synthesis enzyme MnmG [Candidatus Zixiibacteriota bacterium]|nr:MAG: tRNA uridine-5-carboxymethylaminomethyl(34) synthesis enzyme MnmG [candidate division Zixibacteria bacterium]